MSWPSDKPGEWVVTIGDVAIPAKILGSSISGVSRKLKVEKKEFINFSGATITTKGYELVTFKLTLVAWNEAGKRLMWTLVPQLFPAPRQGGPEPIAITHPILALHGVSRVIVEELAGPEEKDQRLTLVASCTQWMQAPKKGTGTTSTEAKTHVAVAPTIMNPEALAASRAAGKTVAAMPPAPPPKPAKPSTQTPRP